MHGSFLARFRAIRNSIWLNPILTAGIDLLSPTKALGDRGELAAERFLLKKGHIIAHRSYRDSIGELDLVSIDQRTVVFVEVKTRTSDAAGLPAEAVDQEKQERVVRTAVSYMKRHDLLNCSSRFDVISISWPANNRRPSVVHIPHAFEAHVHAGV